VFDKENLIKFLLDFLYYLYNYYMVCALLSHVYYVTHYVTLCNVILWLCDTCDITLSHTLFYIVSPRWKKRKNKKKYINNNLAILPSYNKQSINVTKFIWPYLYQFFNNSHGLNSYGKPSKRPFDQCQSCLETINIGRDIRQINW